MGKRTKDHHSEESKTLVVPCHVVVQEGQDSAQGRGKAEMRLWEEQDFPSCCQCLIVLLIFFFFLGVCTISVAIQPLRTHSNIDSK